MSSRKVVVLDAPQSEFNKSGYCKNGIVKSSVNCSKGGRGYHPSCAGKLRKCCGREIISSLKNKNGNDITFDVEDRLKSSEVSTESSKYDLLLTIISVLEAKNEDFM
ncbi:hypothetical protein WA026_022347 [Henosepilachna vigintioctopunctata]|uniref:Uncharacterized protein n=1 Tax=Henosepilachna vigintioctopunctata TaxID=420089 RepID=A0AAW1UY93_9CUCU